MMLCLDIFKNYKVRGGCHSHQKIFFDQFIRPLNIREIKEEAKDLLYMDEINNECTILSPPTGNQVRFASDLSLTWL